MNDRTFGAILIILYPAFILLTILIFMVVYGYLSPEKHKSSRSIEHRVRK